MRFEPSIARTALIAAIDVLYGITATGLEFVPYGFMTACYVVQTETDGRLLLKLWPAASAASETAARQEIALPLLRALHDRGLFTRVPAPLATREGALWADVAAGRIALYPYLSGRALADDEPLPAPLRDEFARTIAAIHAATPSLGDLLPPRETFDTPYCDVLRRCLERARAIEPNARPGLWTLRALVLPAEAEIAIQIERLAGLQARLRALDGPFVLCHTDLGGSNLLIDDTGRLYVLDWDWAQAAPPEFDLWSCLGKGLARSLAVYRDAGGAAAVRRTVRLLPAASLPAGYDRALRASADDR